jgi:TolA-binding protein
VAQAKLELQAAQLLAAIRELERQNAMAKAKPKLRELWKRFPLTPAAQEAAAAWPALYAELSGK